MNPDTTLVRRLVSEEIRRMVADYIRAQGCLRSGQHATRIANAFPNSGLTPDQIAEEVLAAAVSSQVAVEIARPEPLERRV